MFHQMIVERMRDMQPTDECGNSHVVITVIDQSHLALKITDILLDALPRLYFDDEEVVTVFLELRREAYYW